MQSSAGSVALTFGGLQRINRRSHMAGVCLGKDGEEWLERHDRHSRILFTHRSNRVQVLGDDETLRTLINARRDITNWDALFFRLRSLFDGYASAWYPSPPPEESTDGAVTYESRREVLCLRSMRDTVNERQMQLQVRNVDTGSVFCTEMDLVVAADGPNSTIRAKYLPRVHRRYVGYIAWRGTVLERDISPPTRQLFRRSLTVHRMAGHHHCIVYLIPGKHGSLEPGQRLLNFVWYTNESHSSLEDILKDAVDGHRHHYFVPAGRVCKNVWEERVGRAYAVPFPAPFLEVMTKIRRPFVQVITDFCSPRASFEQGRLLLVGDALSLFRPHTAFSGTQAAFHALMVEKYVSGTVRPAEWEEKVLRYSALHWSQSMFYGQFYQNYLVIALLYRFHHWIYCFVDFLKSSWRGEQRLLRASSAVAEEYDSE
ncbi:hypothetical protein L249_1676 [Ophiocordyceps polyrhachis-furcata BCC 54312]|uniref:2,6-dihydroxypyridine 3-monooxygenase substrate binding domain-containing protein n=1 Tax=Ophiocordyceps polyrhachis-furcata BCC 54312 TaxID=1330021 RepID=A0A367L081_9HYPO|nr:hypothetical protein L249_1676 [Ophiocordyceps polyrhachis-furcata BCC 54312]